MLSGLPVSRLAVTMTLSLLVSAGCDDSWIGSGAYPGGIEYAENPSKRIKQENVCFTVHNLGDVFPHQVSGTLYYTKSSPRSTAIVLQHGSAVERSIWEGGYPYVSGVPSVARQLAAAGYAVFSVDRLGYGRSPYLGSGWQLTVDGYIEMTREMIAQIRNGTYRTSSTGSCAAGVVAGTGASKVVLVGQSGSASLIEMYATRHHDVDGIIPMFWSSQGPSSTFGPLFLQTLAAQFALGRDYVYLFPADEFGYSQVCEDYLFFAPGVSDEVVAQVCGPGYFGNVSEHLSPSAEMAQAAETGTAIQAGVRFVGPSISVLKVYADMDAVFPGPEYGNGEEDSQTPDMAMWENECNCDVSFLVQENASHAGQFHDSGPQLIADVIDWLRSRGF